MWVIFFNVGTDIESTLWYTVQSLGFCLGKIRSILNQDNNINRICNIVEQTPSFSTFIITPSRTTTKPLICCYGTLSSRDFSNTCTDFPPINLHLTCTAFSILTIVWYFNPCCSTYLTDLLINHSILYGFAITVDTQKKCWAARC